MTPLTGKELEFRSTPGFAWTDPYFLCVYEALRDVLHEHDNPEVTDTIEKCMIVLHRKYRDAKTWTEEDWAEDKTAFIMYADPDSLLDKVT